MFKFKNKIRKLGAGLMAGLCAFSMLGTSVGNAVQTKAANAITTENSAFPTADKVIAQAATLLGSPYGWGFKGYTGVYYQGSYSPLSLDYVRNQGVDCSGLIYYTLTHLGYKTSGFSWNNPVPVDTTHWLTVGDNCTISYGGVTSKIDVEKENLPTPSNTQAAKTYEYWECADGSTITPGSVVIADNLNGEDHSWIYMGEFDSRDDVVDYLRNIGVSEDLITSKTVGDGNGDGGTHWRIESNGSEGCVVNNRTDGKKSTAMNVLDIRDTLDRLKIPDDKPIVEFSISEYDNMKLPYSLCRREFSADIYRLNLFAERMENLDFSDMTAFKSLLNSNPESDFEDTLKMTYGNAHHDINIEIGRPENCFFRLLAAPDFEKKEQAQWVTLPCDEGTVSYLRGMVCLKFQSSLPGITRKSFEKIFEIGTLNQLSERLSELSHDNFVKLKAVMESESICEISDTIDCIGRLSEYQFDRNISDPSGFGRNYLARNLPTNFDISVLENADLHDFGSEILNQKQGEITSYGAISGRGQELYSALTVQPEQQLDEDFEEDYEENFEMEMGGLQ
ncbi:MAG: hypothetical protein NC093_11180 [Alistipes sp.]|nr:hypothetical protein [Alistipes sp.]